MAGDRKSIGLVAQSDPLDQQNQKLEKIIASLMRRVEQAADEGEAAYHHFERAIMLEDQVRARTRDLEKAYDQLNKSNARLHAANQQAEGARNDLYNALEAVREGFALFDPNDEMILCNSRFCQWLPDVANALGPGLKFQDYVRLVAQSGHLALPDEVTPERWTKERLRKHQKPHVNFNLQITGGRWLQISEHRTPNQGTAILQTDITAMIRLERQERNRLLDDQARLIRATLDHVNQGICIFDSENRLAGWNDKIKEMLALPMQFWPVGTAFIDIIEHLRGHQPGFDESTLLNLCRWVEQSEPSPTFSLEFATSDGRIFDVFTERMPDASFVMSLTDRTFERHAARDLKRANADLAEANRELAAVNELLESRVEDRTTALKTALADAKRANDVKSRFVAAASHDLLQPLNAAKLFLSALQNTAGQTDQQKLIGRIDSAFDSVESILGALLDISRLDSGKVSLNLSTFPIASLLQPLVDQFQPLAAQKGIDLRYVPSSACVISDPAYLRRIMQNLVANAVRYTAQGKILLGARPQGHAIKIYVGDTGPGIPAAQQQTIFQEFQRFAQANRSDPGMGLGLAIVDRACRLLDHPLTLHSKLDQGSVFTVTVPLAAAPHNLPGNTMAAREPVKSVALEQLVLVIENDEPVRQATVTLLEHWGMQTLDVPSGAAALALLADIELAPDIIVADFHLDDGATGIDAIQEIRSRYGAIPAIVITADRSQSVAQSCHEIGARLLAKPIEPNKLRSLLTN